MKAVSTVVAVMVLIAITIIGFTLAYPIFFAKTRSIYGGAGAVFDSERHSKAVDLQLLDYSVSRSGGSYVVVVWMYNAGWEPAHVRKLIISEYTYTVDTVIQPCQVKYFFFTYQSSQAPSKIVVVADEGVYTYNLG